MKIFDCDWTPILDFMPVWDEMTPASRKRFLDPDKAHVSGSRRAEYGNDAAIMLQAGLVFPSSKDFLIPEKDRGKLFRRILMQFSKHLLFEPNVGSEAIEAYQRKHFSNEEWNSLFENTSSSGTRIRVTTENWSRSFLEAPDPLAWEEPMKVGEKPVRGAGSYRFGTKPPRAPEEITYFTSPAVGKAARMLVRIARESSSPVPFRRLRDPDFQQFPTQVVADAFKACLRYALLFPALDSDSYEARFWIWPPTGNRLHRPAATQVGPVVRETHLLAPPFRLEDLTLIAARTATDPLAMKKQSFLKEFYAKVRQELIETMSPLPPSLAERFPAEERLSDALQMLLDLKFVSIANGNPSHLKLRKAGSDWLAGSAPERLRLLLETISANREEAGSGYFKDRYSSSLAFNPLQLYVSARHRSRVVQLSPLLETVWSSANEGEFYPLDEWLAYHSRESYPTGVTAVDYISDSLYGTHKIFEEVGEALLRNVHDRFFFERLIPFGGVELGQDSRGRLCFALNETGRYFLTGAGTVEAVGDPNGTVLVQPNFEIVFTQPNPLAEAELTGLAERIGNRVGTLFRLSGESIRRAALIGSDAERTLSTLERVSGKPIPPNVRRQIEDWFGSCREVGMRRTTLLTFPDEVTAQTVSKELADQCEPITPTIWEVRTKTLDRKTLRRLEKKGIFLRSGE